MKTMLFFLGASFASSALLLAGAGCSGGGTGGTAGSGGGASSSTTSTGGSTSSTGTGGSSTSTGTGGTAAAPTCTTYCATIKQNCSVATPAASATQQYPDDATCMAVCASFPTTGMTGDQSGDTLQCRAYHATAAASNATLHCPHAGPTGGSSDPASTGVCGDPCEAFCNLEAVACTGANQVYATTSDCTTACKAFKAPGASDPPEFSDADTAGNTFDCRMYHLTAATQNPTLHCPHTAVTSAVCM